MIISHPLSPLAVTAVWGSLLTGVAVSHCSLCSQCWHCSSFPLCMAARTGHLHWHGDDRVSDESHPAAPQAPWSCQLPERYGQWAAGTVFHRGMLWSGQFPRSQQAALGEWLAEWVTEVGDHLLSVLSLLRRHSSDTHATGFSIQVEWALWIRKR